TFTEAVLSPAAGRMLVVTFDDAYRSTFEHAAPVLARLGLPGTLFVPTAWVDRQGLLTWPTLDYWLGTAHEGELEPMSWEEIAAPEPLEWPRTCVVTRDSGTGLLARAAPAELDAIAPGAG